MMIPTRGWVELGGVEPPWFTTGCGKMGGAGVSDADGGALLLELGCFFAIAIAEEMLPSRVDPHQFPSAHSTRFSIARRPALAASSTP
jgi:hypothetical protein